MNSINIESFKVQPYKLNRDKMESPTRSYKKSFNEVFNHVQNPSYSVHKENKIKFSKHAKERIVDRAITLTEKQLKKLNEAVMKAEKKGVKEALILMDDTAFIASIKQKTVITIMTTPQLLDHTITNIDGAIIM